MYVLYIDDKILHFETYKKKSRFRSTPYQPLQPTHNHVELSSYKCSIVHYFFLVEFCNVFMNVFSEKWINAVGFVFISGQKFNNEWKINNSIAIFTYWDVSYPSNIASNRCIAQNLDPNYRWRDVSCDQKLHYLCEVISRVCTVITVCMGKKTSSCVYLVIKRLKF